MNTKDARQSPNAIGPRDWHAESFAAPSEQAEIQRRQMLAWAVGGAAAVGMGLSTVPFIESWEPSESARARGAPVDVSLADLEPATMRLVTWRRQPIFVVRRTSAMIAELPQNDARLRDPYSRQSEQPVYADNEYRARRPAILVLIGVCTHLGCLPRSRFVAGDPTLGARWPGGFYCP